MNEINLAPIGLSVYIRFVHIKETIEALQKNTLAESSELYIFSDAPRKGDEEKVKIVREYLKTIDGFKNITVFERKKNSIAINNLSGIKYLLDNYGKMIFLEEDIVTAPGFLKYINDALEFYKDDDRILSITGYCPPIEIPDDYKHDVFIVQGFNAWGMAMYKNKYNMIGDVEESDYLEIANNKKLRNDFTQNCGEGMFSLLKIESRGEIDALDVKATYHQFKSNMYTMHPIKSLVQNIGNDGSGVHCSANNKFDVELWDKVDGFNFVKDIQTDNRILRPLYNFRKLDTKTKIAEISKKIGLYPILKTIYEKVR